MVGLVEMVVTIGLVEMDVITGMLVITVVLGERLKMSTLGILVEKTNQKTILVQYRLKATIIISV
jgi:hypothetical protein